MANHKSAQKRIRQSERRRQRNKHIRTGMRTQISIFLAAVESKDGAQAQERFRAAERAIRKAASKGVIPARRASRKVGRLSQLMAPLA